MSFVLVVVVVTGLALGYWLVSALISPQAPEDARPGPEPDAADADALAPEIHVLARQRAAEIEAAYLEAMRGLQRR